MTIVARCFTVKKDGELCKNAAMPGKIFCRWHSPNPEDIARHLEEARRGGVTKAYGSLVAGAALMEDPAVAELDLTTADGLKRYLAATLRGLGKLPLDVRIGAVISQLASAQRAIVESSDLESRLAALEAAQAVGA
jgi:hypothetical protein